MPIKEVFDTQDAVPEFLKNAVIEQDGKWVFEAETVAEVGNLKSTLKKERDSRTKFEAELKRFERFKPLTEAEEDELSEFFERWEKRNEPGGKGRKDADPDAAKQLELKDKLHAKELKKLSDDLAKLTSDHDKAKGELREFKLWTPLREVALKAGLNAEDWELARLDLSNQGRFSFDDEGKLVVMEDGSPSTVTPEKFFKEMYSDVRPKFYKASGASGSGASNAGKTGGSGKKTMSRAAFDQLPHDQRSAFIKAGGEVV